MKRTYVPGLAKRAEKEKRVKASTENVPKLTSFFTDSSVTKAEHAVEIDAASRPVHTTRTYGPYGKKHCIGLQWFFPVRPVRTGGVNGTPVHDIIILDFSMKNTE